VVKVYFYIVALIAHLFVVYAVVVPKLISAEHDELFVLGIVIAVTCPIGLVKIAKNAYKAFEDVQDKR
jgi:hypothetical protein